MRPIAGNAALRVFQNSWRSASSRATRTSSEPQRSQIADDLVEARLALVLGAVELDQQRRAAADRIAGVGHLLGGLDRQLVHHLDRARARRRPARSRDTASPARVRGVEERDQRLDRLGRRARRAATTLVATPSVPSEPTNAPSRS